MPASRETLNDRNTRAVARIVIAATVGVLAALIAAHDLWGDGPNALGHDYTLHWWASRALLAGKSPYDVINAISPAYPYCSGYLYWLPAAVFLAPFAALSVTQAMSIFTGISTSIFTFAITKDGYSRLPALLSAPIVYATLGGQVTPLVVGAMLLPALQWLTPMKFTLGFAGALYQPTCRAFIRYVVAFSVPVVLSVIVWPWWPAAWVRELSDVAGVYYDVPIRVIGGALVLLAVVKWRRPEARLLLVMACLPQTMFNYDQLPLVLVPATLRESLVFALLTHLPATLVRWWYGPYIADRADLFHHYAPFIVGCYYIPALVMVLRRPNEGAVPAWLDRFAHRLPSWLRGQSVSERVA